MKTKIDNLSLKARKKLLKILLEIQKDRELLYELLTLDEKTRLYNYRFFKDIFNIEFEEAKRGTALSFLIIDIDFFKKINDKYGHLRGDKILVQLAKILKLSTRKSDILARFGGEEFLILLLHTPLDKAGKVAERIRKAVEQNKTMQKYSVTISGGLASYKKSDTKDRMKKRADLALYKAKKLGRNRIEIK